jgi:hypothetical protein
VLSLLVNACPLGCDGLYSRAAAWEVKLLGRGDHRGDQVERGSYKKNI